MGKLSAIIRLISENPDKEFDVEKLSKDNEVKYETLFNYLKEKSGIFFDFYSKGDKFFVKARISEDSNAEKIEVLDDLPDLEKEERKIEKFSSKAAEIGSRFENLKDIKDKLPKIRDVLLDSDPKEAFKSYIDHSVDEIEKEKLKAGYEILSTKFIEEAPVELDIESLKENVNGLIAGTDATRRLEFDIIRIESITIPIAVFFSAVCGLVFNYFKGEKLKDDDIFRRPQYPATAEEQYMEEMYSKFPNIDGADLDGFSTSMSSYLHYLLDKDIISKKSPNILFRDGPLRPGQMSYLDLKNPEFPERADITWKSIYEAVEVKNRAKIEGTKLVGVTKHVNQRFLSPILNQCLLDNLPGWTSQNFVNDQQILPMILKNGEHSPVVIHHLLGTHLPESKREGAERYLENRFPAYERLASQLDYTFTFINTEGYCNRFEFYYDNSTDFNKKLKEIYAPIIYTSGPAMRKTREGVLSKRYEILPSPVWGADREAKLWGDQIQDYLFRKLEATIMDGVLK
ncbi:MAG TPA: hypothetical protein VIO58_03645 [Candidatus Methanoperedens sp.]